LPVKRDSPSQVNSSRTVNDTCVFSGRTSSLLRSLFKTSSTSNTRLVHQFLVLFAETDYPDNLVKLLYGLPNRIGLLEMRPEIIQCDKLQLTLVNHWLSANEVDSNDVGGRCSSMTDLLLQVLLIAYASVSVVAALAYLPTVRDLLHQKLSANIASYSMWTATSGVTFLYSLFILPDFLFRLVSGVNFGSCAVILCLCANLKYRGNFRQ